MIFTPIEFTADYWPVPGDRIVRTCGAVNRAIHILGVSDQYVSVHEPKNGSFAVSHEEFRQRISGEYERVSLGDGTVTIYRQAPVGPVKS